MNLKKLIKLTEKPEIYKKGTESMWTDEYISGQLLAVHLNENIDLASRKKTTIDKTVEWILKQVGGENLSILDLGCGPGLYAEPLAGKGHRITGVDYSKRSIDYAKNNAEKKNLDITYINENYLNLDFENMFDLVLLIYTDFGVLLPDERELLLLNIHKALKPGGKLVFDVLNDKNINQKAGSKNWELADKGFWIDKPYLALSNSFLFDDQKVILFQHTIIDENENYKTYRFWTHFFNENDISNILGKNDFQSIGFHDDVLPESDLWSGDNVTFCVAAKRTDCKI